MTETISQKIENREEQKRSSSICILVVGWSAPPYNGMTTATEIVLRSLSEEFDVVFLDIADKRDLSNVGRLDLNNVALAIKHGVQFLFLLWRRRPHIVYVPIAQSSLPFLRDCLFLIPSRLLNRRVVVHLHGGHFAEFRRSCNWVMRAVIRFALGKVERVIVLGQRLRSLFDGVVPDERVVAIPNGISDYDGLGLSARRNGRTLLYLGALMKSKGVIDLLTALSAVRERVPDVRLVLTGEWLEAGDRAEAMRIIDRQKLQSCVALTGRRGAPEKYSLYREADIFVMPTFYPNEGHPYSILEAMCAGLPVISTDTACIPETVLDGQTGYIVAKHDPGELSARIIELLLNDDLRTRMGVAARKRFENYYTDRRFSQQFCDVYRELETDQGRLQ